MNLNGWQRLWVVFAVAAGGMVGIEAIKAFPGEDTASRNARYEVLAAYGRSDLPRLVDCMTKAGDVSHSLDNPNYQRCDELSRGMTAAESQTAHERIQSLLPQKRDDLKSVKAQIAGGYAVGWLAIVVAVYGLGLIAGWISRGFKS